MATSRKRKYADPPAWLVVGAVVDYSSVIGAPPSIIGTRVRSEPWQLGHGQWVVKIDGVAGGVAVEALRQHVPSEPEPRTDLTGCDV